MKVVDLRTEAEDGLGVHPFDPHEARKRCRRRGGATLNIYQLVTPRAGSKSGPTVQGRIGVCNPTCPRVAASEQVVNNFKIQRSHASQLINWKLQPTTLTEIVKQQQRYNISCGRSGHHPTGPSQKLHHIQNSPTHSMNIPHLSKPSLITTSESTNIKQPILNESTIQQTGRRLFPNSSKHFTSHTHTHTHTHHAQSR